MDNYHKLNILPVVLCMPVIIYLMLCASDLVDFGMAAVAAVLAGYCFLAGICISEVENRRRQIRKIIKNGKCTVGTVKKIIVIDRVFKGSNTRFFKTCILEVEAETEFRKFKTFYSMPIYPWKKKKVSQTARVYTWNNRYFVWHEKFKANTSYLTVTRSDMKAEFSVSRLIYDIMTIVGCIGMIVKIFEFIFI